MNFSVTTLFALLATSSFAFAAGPVPTVIEAPVIAAETYADTDWTGFYAGAQIGKGNAELSYRGASDDGDFDAVGLHGGYLNDFGTFVLGGEFSYDSVELDGFSGSADLVRLRARAGADLGRFLPYATLGVAVLSDSDASDSAVTYGIGVDYMVTGKVTIGAEYTHTQFDDFLEDDTNVSGIDLDADLVQMRVSYHF